MGLKAKLIIEIMGRPPEHIKEALNTLVVKMGSENGVSLISKEYHEPRPVENTDNLWIAFADVEAEFDVLERFFSICMSYMPSHVEIYEPEKFKLDAGMLNSLGNFLISKLHNYDAIAKRLLGERDILINQLNVLKNNVSAGVAYDKKSLPKKERTKTNKNKRKSAKKKK